MNSKTEPKFLPNGGASKIHSNLSATILLIIQSKPSRVNHMNTSDARGMLEAATAVAISRMARVQNFRFGTVGIRGRDGVMVASYNELAPQPEPRVHAEARLSRKLTPGSVIAVVRLSAMSEWCLSRPCPSCERILRNVGVKRAYYSIGIRDGVRDFGTMDF